MLYNYLFGLSFWCINVTLHLKDLCSKKNQHILTLGSCTIWVEHICLSSNQQLQARLSSDQPNDGLDYGGFSFYSNHFSFPSCYMQKNTSNKKRVEPNVSYMTLHHHGSYSPLSLTLEGWYGWRRGQLGLAAPQFFKNNIAPYKFWCILAKIALGPPQVLKKITIAIISLNSKQ